jgi:hypothetical protein
MRKPWVVYFDELAFALGGLAGNNAHGAGHQILEQYLDSGYSPSAAAGSSSISSGDTIPNAA